MAGVQHEEVFDCSPEKIFAIVSDYERYPEFLNEVQFCQVLEVDGNRKRVRFRVSVVKTFEYELWMTESPFEKISWTLACGSLFKKSDGGWEFYPLEGGKRTRAIYTVEASFQIFVPKMVTRALLSTNLPLMMQAYQKRCLEKESNKMGDE